jgi:phage FluMu gp28-like protein
MNPLATMPSATADAPPPVLLPYQQRWMADTAALKVAEKGRRIGLTWAEAADNALNAARADGHNTYYVGPNESMAREYIEAVAMWSRSFSLTASEIGEGEWADDDRSIKTFEVVFPQSGHRVVALTSRPSNLRGKQGDIVVDEAAFHKDLGALLKAALAMLLWGNRVRIISTHDGVENPFAELIADIRAGKRGQQARVHRITFRDAVAEGLYRRVCIRRRKPWTQADEDAWVAEAYRYYGDDAAEELDAVPSASAGAYLPLALIEARMVDLARGQAASAGERSVPTVRLPALIRWRWDDAFAQLPEDVRRYAVAGQIAEELAPVLDALDVEQVHAVGLDFGRVSDLTVIWVLAQGRDVINRTRVVLELRNCPFRAQEQILFALADGLPRLRAGALDATGNGAALAEYAAQRYGSATMEQVKLNDGFYLAHMPKLRAGLQDATLVDLPRDTDIRDDLRAIAVINGVPKLVPAKTRSAEDRRATRHGDAAIALFLAQYAMSREVNAIGWEQAPPSGPWVEAATDDYFLALGT